MSLLTVQLLIGSLSAVAGSVGAKNQSSALSQASQSISTSLAQKPTGTGKIPTFRPNSPAPSVNVGAGGQGAKMQQPEKASRKEGTSLSDEVGEMAEQSQKDEHTQPEVTATVEGEQQGKSLSDEVGEMAEQSHKEEPTQPEDTAVTEGETQGTVLRERREDEPRNPKKRMWEEPIDRSVQEKQRDEL